MWKQGLRLATIWKDGWEMAAVVVPGGAVPVIEIHDPFGSGWPADLLSLLESGRFYELWHFCERVMKDEVKKLSSRVVPFSKIEYGPLYRRARKIWGIGLNYVEHADDLQEIAPRRNRQPSCGRTRASSDWGRRYGYPTSQSG